MTREDIQIRALQELKQHKRLILQWGTGVGKGYFGVYALSQLLPEKVLLLVAETAHKKNWKEEFKNQGFGELYDKITVECYASIKKYEDTSWDMIILDEFHHTGSSLRMAILKTIKAPMILCLSATVKRDLIDQLNSIFGVFRVNTISLQNAIYQEWLPEPKIKLIPLTLNSKDVTETFVETWGKAKDRIQLSCPMSSYWTIKRNKKKFPAVELTVSCTQLQKYVRICDNFEYYRKLYMSTHSEAIKNQWLQWGSKRKSYLGSLKTEITKQLLEKIKKKRFICFCTNIEQVKDLGGTTAIHSQNNNNDEIIQKFNNKEINSLFAVNMLKEGQNLEDIQVGIIVQLDGNERDCIQKIGRIMRAKHPEIYILYYKNTRDEEFLKNAVENMNKKYIKEVKL